MVQRSTAQERRPDAWLDRIVSRLPRVNDAAADSSGVQQSGVRVPVSVSLRNG